MKRRGSYWSGILDGMIDRFEEGMMVEPVFVKRQGFYGTVTEVNKPENKVYVAWGDGAISQEDPDMIMPSAMNAAVSRRTDLPKELDNKYRTVAKELEAKSKDWKYNPWAVCHATVDKDKDPEEFEKCVMDMKKKQSSRRSIYSSENGKVYQKTLKSIKK